MPAHSLVRVTVLQYDTATGLRNPYWGGPRGIVGVMSIDGKPTPTLDPDLASHTFAIPDLGVSVPLKGVADDAKNQCSVAPCTLAEAHTTVVFTIRTGKARHLSLAVLRALRGRLHPRLRRPDAERRLHGRLPARGRVNLRAARRAGCSSVWVVLSAIAVPLIVLVLGPHLPPGKMSAEANDQTSANTVLTALIAPIVLLLVVYFGYALAVFRARGDELEDGAADPRATARRRSLWLVVTSAIVLGLAVWGSDTLDRQLARRRRRPGPEPGCAAGELQAGAAGAGDRAAVELDVPLPVLRRRRDGPSRAARRTRDVEFHVTSLDVVHSFWAYQLGVKADAVPGVDNIAFVNPRELGIVHDPLRGAVRALARPHVPDRAGRRARTSS